MVEARNSPAPTDSPAASPPLLAAWVPPGQTLDEAWLEAAGRRLGGGGVRIGESGEPAPDRSGLQAATVWLAEHHPGRDVLLLRGGLELPEHTGRRLEALARAAGEAPLAVVLPGNHAACFDPLAGSEWPLEAAGLDSLAAACGERCWRPVAWPGDRRLAAACLWLNAPAVERLAGGDPLSLNLADDFYVLDPARSPGGEKPEGAPAPLGDLRERLLGLAREGVAELPYFGLDGRPVTLHISHNWGGGVARWIEDFIAGDPSGHHLVLEAASDFQAREYGQWLSLYGAGPGRGRIRTFALTPPIAATATGHAGYAETLAAIVERFGVGRVVVSSLIGHSLEALETGLPTAQVLHDYYPAWPLLDHDPLPWTRTHGPPRLGEALVEKGRGFLFAETDPEFWRALAGDWRGRAEAAGVRLIAPGRHVAARWQRLFPEAELEIERIAHGFRPFDEAPPVEPPPGKARKLHLVVLGRLSAGKGLGLLAEALPRLAEHARITCLGAGRQGHRLFGRPGVDVVLDYRREELPALLATLKPDAALFLSTVPETWNYALSEARSLGLVPIATHLGSFAERIRHLTDGVLIDPDPDALVSAVAKLAGDRESIRRMRRQLPAEPDLESMACAYNQSVPPDPAPAGPYRPPRAWDAERARLAGRLAELDERNRALESERASLDAELARRARWAETMERRFRDRSRWADELEAERGRLATLLASERERLEGEIARLKELLASEQARLEGEVRRLGEVLERERARLESALAERQAELDRVSGEMDLIVNSRSWRLTRPLRALNRLVANARARGLHNPFNWPGLLRGLFRNLRLRGLRQTLYPKQAPAAPPPEPPPTVVPAETPAREEALKPVALEPVAEPRASIIVPVHNQAHLTAACLHSLVKAASRTPFEVVVVDDASTDATAEYLRDCRGLEVVTNSENLGFIGACNRGAAAARGEYLVFLNNDTTVTDGWLDALIAPFEGDPAVGIVGARLVYPDGRLQEAGGIVFSDASGWNYGRGENPDRPEFNFLSEADYVSGACLAISRQRFAEFGGFDAHFAPAYYEDTDLCFRARQAGLKVIYQPACTVIHHEGATSGTDESAGAKRFQAVNREKFRARWAGVLARHPAPPADTRRADPVRALRFRHRPRRALVIDAVTPMPDHDSGSVRMFALMRILGELGYQVSFIPENLAWADRYSRDLQQAGIEVVTAPWITDPEQWLAEHGESLDLVLVSRHYVLITLVKLIRAFCPKAPLVFDTVDLHFLREEREAEVTGSETVRKNAAKSRRQELRLVAAADHTLVVSDYEKKLLNRLVPGADVRVVSNIHPVHGRRRDWAERRDLLFVGGFQHLPNQDAARWLIEEIFPRIRAELPEVRLHLIGSKMPEELHRLDAPGIEVHGFVADLEPFLDGCRLSLAPLRYGAGVKGKVNQAMSYGLPVVATSCAAEGMFLEPGLDVLIADDAEAFAREACRAYRDEALWRRLSEGGLENVRRHFSFEAARRALEQLVKAELEKAG